MICRIYWCCSAKLHGNLLISLDRGFIRFRFKISMHIDSVGVLNLIKSKLGVGNVTIEKDRNRCSFVVQDFAGIRDVICPIFIKFPLITSKNLDCASASPKQKIFIKQYW